MWRRRLLFWDHSAIAALEWWPRRLCTDWSWGYCNCRAGEDRRVIEDQRCFFTFAFDKFHMENCYLQNDSRILIIRKSKGRFSGAMQFFTKCPCVPGRRVWMAWGEVVETQASLRLNLFRLGPSHCHIPIFPHQFNGKYAMNIKRNSFDIILHLCHMPMPILDKKSIILPTL